MWVWGLGCILTGGKREREKKATKDRQATHTQREWKNSSLARTVCYNLLFAVFSGGLPTFRSLHYLHRCALVQSRPSLAR